MVASCRRSFEPNSATTPPLLMPVRVASAPADRPSRPSTEAGPPATAMTARRELSPRSLRPSETAVALEVMLSYYTNDRILNGGCCDPDSPGHAGPEPGRPTAGRRDRLPAVRVPGIARAGAPTGCGRSCPRAHRLARAGGQAGRDL